MRFTFSWIFLSINSLSGSQEKLSKLWAVYFSLFFLKFLAITLWTLVSSFTYHLLIQFSFLSFFFRLLRVYLYLVVYPSIEMIFLLYLFPKSLFLFSGCSFFMASSSCLWMKNPFVSQDIYYSLVFTLLS